MLLLGMARIVMLLLGMARILVKLLLGMARIVVHDGRRWELPAGRLELNQLQQSLTHLKYGSEVAYFIARSGGV